MRNNVSLYKRIKTKQVKMTEEREKYDYFIKFMFQHLDYCGADIIESRIVYNHKKSEKLWIILVNACY